MYLERQVDSLLIDDFLSYTETAFPYQTQLSLSCPVAMLAHEALRVYEWLKNDRQRYPL